MEIIIRMAFSASSCFDGTLKTFSRALLTCAVYDSFAMPAIIGTGAIV